MKMKAAFGISYGINALFITMLNNIFLLYHVEIFVSVYHIDKISFWIGEAVFLLWNCLNDPLFGWISDKRFLHSKAPDSFESSTEIVEQRLRSLLWSGPAFAVVFLLFWVQWIFPSLQFIICLCLYDGFLTVVDLHHNALLADLTISSENRASLNFYSSLFSGIGALSVFVSYATWNRQNLLPFQSFCLVLTLFSCFGFYFSIKQLRLNFRKHMDGVVKRSLSLHDFDDDNDNWTSKQKNCYEEEGDVNCSVLSFARQLLRHRNFLLFSGMNLLQVFHCHFNSNFFPLFLDRILGNSNAPSGIGPLLLGASFIVPHVNNLYFTNLCALYGVYKVVTWLFAIKILLGTFMLYIGPDYSVVLLCAFIVSNRVFTEGACKLLNLVISDLVDEDYVINKRSRPVAALLFGTAALLAKPGQSIAPLLGTCLLQLNTGVDVFKSDTNNSNMLSDSAFRIGCFHLLVYVPVVAGIAQLVIWSQFTLHGSKLRAVKALRCGARLACV